MKCRIYLVFFYILRGLEHLLPLPVLCWGLQLLARLRLVFSPAPPPISLPDYFSGKISAQASHREQINVQLAHWLACFPDRLASAKWQNRCRIFGLKHWQDARQAGRPVVLAFFHCGPCYIFPLWLRAAGIPLVPLRVGKSKSRSLFKRVRDKYLLFPELPGVLYLDELRSVIASLEAGNVLLIALDHITGRPMNVPVNENWTFQMATGAVRLATKYNAELIPCCIIDEGNWHFRIELGRPVPKEYLMEKSDLTLAGQHLLQEMLPHIQSNLEQCRSNFFACFHHHKSMVTSERSSA